MTFHYELLCFCNLRLSPFCLPREVLFPSGLCVCGGGMGTGSHEKRTQLVAIDSIPQYIVYF